MTFIKYVFSHVLVPIVLFALPLMLSSHAAWLNLTVGGILTGLYTYFTGISTIASARKPQ